MYVRIWYNKYIYIYHIHTCLYIYILTKYIKHSGSSFSTSCMGPKHTCQSWQPDEWPLWSSCCWVVERNVGDTADLSWFHGLPYDLPWEIGMIIQWYPISFPLLSWSASGLNMESHRSGAGRCTACRMAWRQEATKGCAKDVREDLQIWIFFCSAYIYIHIYTWLYN